MIKYVKKHSNNKGYTLVELIIIIAILAILASAVGLAIIRYLEKARQAIDINNAKLIKDAVATYAYPSDFGGESVTFTDPDTGESETFKRGWVYVDQNEIRCSDTSTALALIDAGLVDISDESAEMMAENEENPNRWFPSGPDGDYVGKTSINEYIFVNKIKVKAKSNWNTYQIDVYINDKGELNLGASASNTVRTSGHSKDERAASMFAEKIGLDGSRITPIGEQNSSR